MLPIEIQLHIASYLTPAEIYQQGIDHPDIRQLMLEKQDQIWKEQPTIEELVLKHLEQPRKTEMYYLRSATPLVRPTEIPSKNTSLECILENAVLDRDDLDTWDDVMKIRSKYREYYQDDVVIRALLHGACKIYLTVAPRFYFGMSSDHAASIMYAIATYPCFEKIFFSTKYREFLVAAIQQLASNSVSMELLSAFVCVLEKIALCPSLKDTLKDESKLASKLGEFRHKTGKENLLVALGLRCPTLDRLDAAIYAIFN